MLGELRTRKLATLLRAATALLAAPAGLAAEIPSTIPDFDMSSVLPAQAVGVVLKTLGILGSHRPYEGASPMGAGSLHLGLEATLVHTPSDITSSLSSLGLGSGSSAAAISLPIAKLHLHKGVNPEFDVGVSGLYYKANYMIGGDVKYTFYQPEEGLTWAVRLGYSVMLLDLSSLTGKTFPIRAKGVNLGNCNLRLRTRTISPQLVAAKKLDFAEPYMAFGLDWNRGQFEVPIQLNILEDEQVLASPAYTAVGGIGALGVSLRVPGIGLRLVMEMAYSTLGMHYLGINTGIGF